jgi:cobalt-zinc-cadmium efflux system protein
MSHAHDHAHGHPTVGEHSAGPGAARRAITAALALNGAFLVIEASVGLVTGSLALLSDAAHMLSDVGSLGLALVAAQAALRPPRGNVTYGLARAEVLGAFVNGLSLLLASTWIVWEAVGRLGSGGPAVPGGVILGVAAIGLAINLGSAWALARAAGGLNVRGALIHMLVDALGSVGAMVAGALVIFGLPIADTVVSLLIAALVLWATVGLLRDSGRILLEIAPAGVSVRDVRVALGEVEGVIDVHDLHVWTLSGSEALLSAHLVVARPSVVFDVRRMLLERFEITHATLQSEEEGCAGPSCEDEEATHG